MLSARESGEGPEMQSFTIQTDIIFSVFEMNRRFVTSLSSMFKFTFTIS